MKNSVSALFLGLMLMISSPTQASLIEEMASEFNKMPEYALEHVDWNQNVSSIDIEQVPAEVIAGLIERGVLPSYDEEVSRRLIGDLTRIEDFTFVVRRALILNFEGGRVAGYAFAIDECTYEECYDFYGMYFFANGDLAAEAL